MLWRPGETFAWLNFCERTFAFPVCDDHLFERRLDGLSNTEHSAAIRNRFRLATAA